MPKVSFMVLQHQVAKTPYTYKFSRDVNFAVSEIFSSLKFYWQEYWRKDAREMDSQLHSTVTSDTAVTSLRLTMLFNQFQH